MLRFWTIDQFNLRVINKSKPSNQQAWETKNNLTGLHHKTCLSKNLASEPLSVELFPLLLLSTILGVPHLRGNYLTFQGLSLPPSYTIKVNAFLAVPRDMKEISFLLRYGYNTDIITLRRMWYRVTCFSRSDLRCRNISRFDDRWYFFFIFLRFDSLCCPPSQGFHDLCLCLLLKLALIS